MRVLAAATTVKWTMQTRPPGKLRVSKYREGFAADEAKSGDEPGVNCEHMGRAMVLCVTFLLSSPFIR